MGQRAGASPGNRTSLSGPRAGTCVKPMYQSSFDFSVSDRAEPAAMAVGEQPPQRIENFGTGALSDTELLALLLHGTGKTPADETTLASKLLAEAGSLHALLTWNPAEFRRLKGIGRIKALQLTATAEVARRMAIGPAETPPLLLRATQIADHLRPFTLGVTVEKFWVCCLTRKNRLIKRIELTSGTNTATLASPRDVFRAALREPGTVSIVVAHNHPSGDPAPSQADIHVTRVLRDGAKATEVELIDHVIVGRREIDPSAIGYYSFREAGLI